MRTSLTIAVPGRGLHLITDRIRAEVRRSGVREGLCHLHLRHTSASLLVQENADPSARRDLEAFFERIAPDGDPRYTHTAEGEDDMSAHIRAALTRTSETFIVADQDLVLGTWQGIYLFEHRLAPQRRTIELLVVGER